MLGVRWSRQRRCLALQAALRRPLLTGLCASSFPVKVAELDKRVQVVAHRWSWWFPGKVALRSPCNLWCVFRSDAPWSLPFVPSPSLFSWSNAVQCVSQWCGRWHQPRWCCYREQPFLSCHTWCSFSLTAPLWRAECASSMPLYFSSWQCAACKRCPELQGGCSQCERVSTPQWQQYYRVFLN